MKRDAATSDVPIEMVGEIDELGIDALADLLIAAARRQQDGEQQMVIDEQEEQASLQEGASAARQSLRQAGKVDGYKTVDTEVG